MRENDLPDLGSPGDKSLSQHDWTLTSSEAHQKCRHWPLTLLLSLLQKILSWNCNSSQKVPFLVFYSYIWCEWIHITDSLMFMLGFTTADVWGLAHFKILYILVHSLIYNNTPYSIGSLCLLLLLSCNWTSENTGFFLMLFYMLALQLESECMIVPSTFCFNKNSYI